MLDYSRMKVLPALVSAFRRRRTSRYNLRLLTQIGAVLLAVIVAFSVVFKYLMALEGQQHSWLTAFYWTIVTMSTLGIGDVTFTTDLGREFTLLVVVTGVVLLLVVFPFTFIEAFYAPWLEARREAQAPRRLPRHVRGHVVLTSSDPISQALIAKLTRYGYSYALLVPGFDEALKLADRGLNVMVGELDDPETYRKAHLEIASLVATSCTRDTLNTNVVSTVRQLSERIPLVSTAQSATAAEVLRRAGANYVIQPSEMLGQSLARRVHGGRQRAHIIARFDGLLVAEATVRGTDLAGRRLAETGLREETGLTVLGAWRRGQFEDALAGLMITDNSALVLAGSAEQLERFNERYPQPQVSAKPVVIVGGGRVGQAAGRALDELDIDYRIVEQHPDSPPDPRKWITGDAARLEVLRQAGIDEAPTAIITTRDDDVNIYLTVYLRGLRPEMLIISRSMHERNLATLHRGGADFVMSHASMGANTIFNLLRRSDIEMLAEGLDIFRLAVPPPLSGKSIAAAAVRERTGCTVIALITAQGTEVNPDPLRELPADAELLMIGTVENEARFLKAFPGPRPV